MSTMYTYHSMPLTVPRIKMKEDDDHLGPTIRHPSGKVYLDTLYLREKNDKTKLSSAAKLYQTIMEYALSEDKTKEGAFKGTNIAYWVLDHNQDYIDHYRHSKLSLARQKLGVLKRIKKYLHNLEQWGLIRKVGEVGAVTKNGQMTPLYRFTFMGYIVAWLLEYDSKPDKRNTAKRMIFDQIQLLLTRDFYSSMTDLSARFYSKCMEKDLEVAPFLQRDSDGRVVGITIMDWLIVTFIRVLSSGNFHFPKAIEYLSKAQNILLTDKRTCEMAVGLYLEALDECSDHTRKNVMILEKVEIESRFVISQPSKDWEEKYRENINNYDTLVLYGVCQNKKCRRRYYPVLVQFYDYRKKIASSKTDFNYVTEECVYCNTKNSLCVFNSYEAVRLYMN